MTDDLTDAVPPHELAEDALAFTGKLALSAIPGIGPMAVEALSHTLESRQARRQHDFNVLIAHRLADALAQLEGTLTVEEFADSDEFLSTLTRAQRAAAETASDAKRQRLAAAVAHSGDWAPYARAEREQFLRLVETFGDIHVWLLHYFDDSIDWRGAHGIPPVHIYEASNDNPLSTIFGVPLGQWWGPVSQATDDLEREHLVAIPTDLASSPTRQLSARTTPKGRHFLRFLSDPPSAEAATPTL